MDGMQISYNVLEKEYVASIGYCIPSWKLGLLWTTVVFQSYSFIFLVDAACGCVQDRYFSLRRLIIEVFWRRSCE